jgi:NDP-sugar pyrophosphorylase family protein
MKAMVLAAGLGTRMRPLSDLLAKPALPVLNRPLLQWTLEWLAREGVRDVVVNTHHLPETVERAVGSGRRFGLRIRFSHEPEILGSGGGPRRVRELFGRQTVLLVNGDCLFDFDLRTLAKRHRAARALATLVLKPNPDTRRYGPVVTGPRGIIRSIRRLPRPARGPVSLFTGVQLVEPALFDRLDDRPSDIVVALYAPLLAEGGRLLGLRMRGPWLDFGSPDYYLRSQIRLLANARGRRANGSLVDPAARVHPRARMDRSVVGAGALVARDAAVSRSVLWPEAEVGESARLEACIVTSGARVASGERLSRLIVLPRARLPLV